MKQQYTNYFYGQIQENACNSAAAIVDFFLRHVQCQSVVDIGCARGAWLNAFVDAGLSDVLGVDGEWVSLETLMIPQEKFVRADLSKPLFLHRRFDVAICLEVAEHLPEKASNTLVHTLVNHADAILFSAAIPYQPGIYHMNCQWPAYWAKKFAMHGYVASDFLRPNLWEMSQVGLPYRQNTCLYINTKRLSDPMFDKTVLDGLTDCPRSRVHPDYYMYIAGNMSAKIDMCQTISYNLHSLWNCIVHKVEKLWRKD